MTPTLRSPRRRGRWQRALGVAVLWIVGIVLVRLLPVAVLAGVVALLERLL